MRECTSASLCQGLRGVVNCGVLVLRSIFLKRLMKRCVYSENYQEQTSWQTFSLSQAIYKKRSSSYRIDILPFLDRVDRVSPPQENGQFPTYVVLHKISDFYRRRSHFFSPSGNQKSHMLQIWLQVTSPPPPQLSSAVVFQGVRALVLRLVFLFGKSSLLFVARQN